MIYFLSYPFLFAFLRLLLRGLGRLRSGGEQNVPRRGGVLYCPNHLSDADPTAVFVTAPRRCWMVGKQEIFEIPILGWFFFQLQAIPIHRDSPDRTALRRIEEVLRGGEAVLLFPEGRCSEDGHLQKLQPGVALVALRTGTPIIPIGLQNTNGLLPYGKLVPRRPPAPIIVTYGPPIDPRAFGHLPRSKAIEAITQKLGSELARLTHQSPPPS
jgi:1-acyl-sn-glycerol-3-phosphate acyltransferase